MSLFASAKTVNVGFVFEPVGNTAPLSKYKLSIPWTCKSLLQIEFEDVNPIFAVPIGCQFGPKKFWNKCRSWISLYNFKLASKTLLKDFLKLIKKQSPNYIYSQIDQVIVSALLQRSSEQPKKRVAIDTMNPDLVDDEPFRVVSE